METQKFEKYLLNKRQFLNDMVMITHEGIAKECFQIQLETVEDIIHHFNVIVKGEISSGLRIEDE